jgi:mRNA-degrading endonuclease RelE of RelBE toxin-antitoxin system
MKGYKHYFRIRVADFRIGINVEENKVVLIRFLPRGDIYKHFP